jgi:hypothetical protein
MNYTLGGQKIDGVPTVRPADPPAEPPGTGPEDVSIDELRPSIPITEKDKKDGIRLRHYLFFNGVGLQKSVPRFEVLHAACGGWTWAHNPFCGMCGTRLVIEERHQAVLTKYGHAMDNPLTATKAFAAPPPNDEDPSPAHGMRPLDPHTLQPVGSFHNPIWAQRGPLPGNPEIVRPAPPSRQPDQQTVQQTVQQPIQTVKTPGVLVAGPRRA